NPDTGEGIPFDSERLCQQWLQDQFHKFGCFGKVDFWEVTDGRPNVVAVMKGSGSEGGANDLMFHGHSDVVSVSKEQMDVWKGPGPWSGQIENNRIWGRGAADMKGGNTAFIMAAKMLHEAGINLKGDALITLTIGEESGARQIGCDSILERGYTAPFCVVAEPSNMEFFPVLKGELYFKVKVRGKSTHICNRYLCVHPGPFGTEPPGVNAIDKMLKLQQAFLDLEKEWGLYQKHPLMPPGSMALNISLIKGGESFSSLAESCEATGSILFTPALKSKDVIDELKGVINHVAQTDYWMREHPPEIKAPYGFPAKEPVNLSVEDKGYKTLVQSYKEVMSKDPVITCSPFVCDANYMFEKGLPVIVFGPGDITKVHGSDEYVPVDQILDACRIYAFMMINWCGVASLT
ncbi:ArgE/DapE family deacylase, partial [Candidatus Peregrinibacteria bacterium]|nr:ArgE/DapE family deacylase [Candidatus Peregrinibacteria bacterium]